MLRGRERLPLEPATFLLTRKGFDLLKRHNRLAGYPILSDAVFDARSQVSPKTLEHELACLDVKVALVTALSSRDDIQKVLCTTWPLMCQFRVRQPYASGYGASDTVVKPDGFCSFCQTDADGIAEHYFFFEVDQGTEAQRVLIERAACYRAHFRNGSFAESRGGTREEYEQYPFRVLAVFKTAERRNNAAERLLSLNPPLMRMVWCSTMPEVLRDPLGPIWVQPADYQEVIAGSRHEIASPRHLGRYRRQKERDELVEEMVKKNRLVIVPT